MTLRNALTFSTIIGALFITALLVAFSVGSNKAYGSAPTGLPALVASSTAETAGATATTIAATSTCAARIVTTTTKPIMLTFSDYSGQTPTGTFGHLQLASTTVAYDSGQYGCGRMKAFSFDADSPITVTVTQ